MLGVIGVMTQSFGLLTSPLGMVAMTACVVAGPPMMKIQMLLHLMMSPLLIAIILCALAPWTVLAAPEAPGAELAVTGRSAVDPRWYRVRRRSHA